MKAYPEYNKVNLPWLDRIPAGWSIERSKNIFKSIDIRSKTGQEELLSVSEKHGVTPRKNINVTMFQAESYEGYKMCWPGDLVINSLWAWMQGLGFSRHHGIISSAYGVYRLKNEYADDYKYFDYLIRSKAYLWELRVNSKGIWRSRYQLTDESFFTIPIIIPDKKERIHIARFLDYKTYQINKFIRAKKRMIELLKEQKQYIINDAVTGKIDVRTGKPYPKYKDSGVEWLGQVPEGWEVRKIFHLFNTIGSGTTPESGNSEYYSHGNIPWIITGDLNDGILTETSKHISEKAFQRYSVLKLYPIDSIVVAMYGATIGKVSLISFEACTNQACCVLANPCQLITAEYALKLFIAIKPILVQKGYGGGQPNINQDIIRGLRVPIPPISLQNDIVKIIDNRIEIIHYAISRIEREISLMQEYRTRLIADVVTGKVDVRGIEVPDVPEEEADAPEVNGETEGMEAETDELGEAGNE